MTDEEKWNISPCYSNILIILPSCQIIIMSLSDVSAVVNSGNSGYASTF